MDMGFFLNGECTSRCDGPGERVGNPGILMKDMYMPHDSDMALSSNIEPVEF